LTEGPRVLERMWQMGCFMRPMHVRGEAAAGGAWCAQGCKARQGDRGCRIDVIGDEK
jgi:hypothetical protein